MNKAVSSERYEGDTLASIHSNDVLSLTMALATALATG